MINFLCKQIDSDSDAIRPDFNEFTQTSTWPLKCQIPGQKRIFWWYFKIDGLYISGSYAIKHCKLHDLV